VKTVCLDPELPYLDDLIRLLATGPDDAEWLHVYTSKVPPEFLDRFDSPACPPAQSQLGMAICHWKLAFQPYETLSQRLVAVVEEAGLQLGETRS